jgi:putative heme-binding domain-containing protein
VTALLATVTPQAPPAYVAAAIDAVGQSQAKSAGATLVAALPKLPAAGRAAAIRAILSRPDSSKALLDAIEAGTVRFDSLALDQRTALAASPDKAVAMRAKALLAAGGGLPDPDRQKVIDALKPVLTAVGNAGNGKAVFVKHCAKCHKHGSEGQTIGPDLTGFAVHPKEEILIHVIDPSRSVEGNYKSYTAQLLDGRVVTGLLAAETRTTVELVDAEAKRVTLQRDDIDALTESKKSLMPEGFEKQATAAELTDLLEFLTQKGKFVPVPLDKAATVVTTKGMFFAPDGARERLVFPDWSPKVYGGVPYVLTDPKGGTVKNAILLNGPNGTVAPTMPKAVTLPCHTAARAIHLLSGVGGWCYPSTPKGTTTMTVRLHYADGKTEDHPLKNGVQFADYIRRVDVPGSTFAAEVPAGGGHQQIRTLSVTPKRDAEIATIELVKGPDETAPVVMAVTVETR